MKAPNLVYVVENDRISSVVTELIVKKHLCGGEVRRYVNGRLAFDQLVVDLQDASAVPDLILLDLDMPFMDGWEFLDAFAGLNPAQPTCVFVLTSSIQPEDIEKASGYKEVKGFFTKPLDDHSVSRMQRLLLTIGGED